MRNVLKSIITVVLTMLIGLSVVFGYVSERLLNAQPPTGTIVAIMILTISTILALVMFWKDKTTW
ncbi:MAG: hypothetical protein RMJ14_06085 [Nitrososphaerota archaeon]|nr:hypothetical protein [Aigarchaeota archaeon]MDW8077181.1 hypothetical protein [Nitrososphaerota archaeon]